MTRLWLISLCMAVAADAFAQGVERSASTPQVPFAAMSGSTSILDVSSTAVTSTVPFKLSGSTSGTVTIQVAAIAGTPTFTLPAAIGTAGQVLTDVSGNGTLSWATAAGDMLKTDNLLGLTNYGTARTNLGLGSLATQSGTFSGTSSGTNTGDQTTITGNAGTATVLQTARAINGVSFDGSAAITVTAAGSTLSDTVTVAKGGTGATTLTANRVLLGDGTSAVAFANAGTSGHVLTSNGASAPTFAAGVARWQ